LNNIVLETQREAIVNRPHNLAGSIKGIKKRRFCITDTGVNFQDSTTTPALIKLFMEALDNPIDVGIKSNKNVKIDIKVDAQSIHIKDNGFGIPSLKDASNNKWMAYNAFCEYNSSSNYKENKGQGQKGVNGIGVKLCTTLSTKLIAESDDGKKKIKIVATDNNSVHKVTEKVSTGTGVSVYFEPDFNIFDVNEITQEHIDRMYEYTLIQALTYPELTFRFNGKLLKYTPKQFISMFPNAVLEESKDGKYFVAIAPNEYDDFKQISFINGLETHLGGSHIDYLSENIVAEIRTKLQKKKTYKSIKPGDIKNKLLLIVIAKDMKNVDWDGQTKASITSPRSVMKDYFDIDYTKIAEKVIKTPEIIDNITEFFKIKEEHLKRKELKGLDKKKKIVSEKYLPATKNKRILFLCEGASAVGGLMPALGREDFGYYELKGVPLNAYDQTQAKFTSNPELSELYSIIQNEDYEYICTATDADADGAHIKGLLLGFFSKYLPEYLVESRFGELQTPVQGVIKNKKLIRWVYEIQDLKLKAGETGKYYKGLGSWKADDLKKVVKQDQIQNMINLFDLDDTEVMDNWLSSDKVPARKEYLSKNFFDITAV